MVRTRAMAALAASAALALAACAGDEGGGEPVAAAPPRCAPEHLEAIGDEPKPETLAAAREGRFAIKRVALRLRPPIDWEQNPVKSTAFQGKLQDLTWLDTLLYGYVRGDDGALRQARDIVLDWIAANPFSNPYSAGRVRGDPKPWIDKIAAERAPIIAWARAAARCEGMLSPEQEDALRGSLVLHGRFLNDSGNYHRTNHGLYADQGLHLISGLAPGLPLAKRWSRHAERRFTANLRAHVAAGEGFWLEHSAGYQLAIARLVERFAALGGRSRQLRTLAARLLDTAGWMIEPDGQIVLYGDSNYMQPAAAELRAAEAQDGLGWLPRSGLAFVKRQEEAAYLAVFSSFHSDTHKDADDLSFDLFDAGTRIVSDTGLYHKDFDRFFAFQDSTAAHSVLRTEAGVPIAGAPPYGSGLEARGAAGGWYAVIAGNPLLAPQSVKHTRLYLYRPGYALVVYDQVRSPTEHTYQRLFQLGPEVEVDRSGATLSLSAPELEGSLASVATAPQRLTLARGERRPLAGFQFPRFREAVPRYTATYESEAADLDAVAAFGIEPGLGLEARLDRRRSRGDGTAIAFAGTEGELGTIEVRRAGARLELDVPRQLGR